MSHYIPKKKRSAWIKSSRMFCDHRAFFFYSYFLFEHNKMFKGRAENVGRVGKPETHTHIYIYIYIIFALWIVN